MPLPSDNLFFGLRKTMTEEQLELVNSIIDRQITFCDASAGSGKTTMAVGAMKYLFDSKKIDRVYYIFSPVQEEAMGYRPGTVEEKEADYVAPLMDALVEIREQPDKAMSDKYGWIVAKSHIFMRGTNMKKVGVIIDEAQNWTIPQLKKTITRIHDDCHVVVIGHTGQIDLRKSSDSGFAKTIEHFSVGLPLEHARDVGICELSKNFRGWLSTHADSIGGIDLTDSLWVRAKEIAYSRGRSDDWVYVITVYNSLGGKEMGLLIYVNGERYEVISEIDSDSVLVSTPDGKELTLDKSIYTRARKKFFKRGLTKRG